MKTSQNYGRKRIEPVLLESLDDLTTEKVPRDEKPKIISLSETLLKAKLFYEKEFLNLKKWKRFPELNRLLGGFR